MGKKKKIITGNIEPRVKRTIADVLGAKLASRLGACSVEEYKEIISSKNLTDLQRHAIDCGLTPVADRSVLINRLEKDFSRQLLYSQGATVNKGKKTVTEKTVKNKEILKFMEQAK